MYTHLDNPTDTNLPGSMKANVTTEGQEKNILRYLRKVSIFLNK